MIIYFNGSFIEENKCCISPYDRGFLFADGVYEVIRNTGKKFIELEAHIQRLKTGLEFLRINFKETEKLVDIISELIIKNKFNEQEFLIYIEITRGTSIPRAHLFPSENISPNVFISISKFSPNTIEKENGIKIILHEDVRWGHCNIKTIGLLANVLVRQTAFERNADEAVFVRNGKITEGTHTSFCGFKNEHILIPPLSNFILPGTTRKVILKICRKLEIPYLEREIESDELKSFDELMLFSTTMDVTPVVQIDDYLIGDGKPGELTKKIQKAYDEYIQN